MNGKGGLSGQNRGQAIQQRCSPCVPPKPRSTFREGVITDNTTSRRYDLNPLGEAKPIIDAGGVFNYAKESGML